MKKHLKAIFTACQNIYIQLMDEWRIKYRIIEYNLKTQEILLSARRHSLVLKYNLSTVIKEIWIISALSVIDAALLGYFYGRCYRISQAENKTKKRLKPSPLLLKTEKGRYKILSQNRDGNISYLDSHTRKIYVENPVSIINNYHAIRHFDPTHACYIGILAGLSFEKVQTKKLRPLLRIVD